MTEDLDELAATCFDANRSWWPEDPSTRNKAEQIALMHSELSEMLEGVRKSKQDDHLPRYPAEWVEMADLLIRALDYCGGHRIPIGEVLYAKLVYNSKRDDHKPEIRSLQGGKKF